MTITEAFTALLDNIQQGREFPDVLDSCASQVDDMTYSQACDELTSMYDVRDAKHAVAAAIAFIND